MGVSGQLKLVTNKPTGHTDWEVDYFSNKGERPQATSKCQISIFKGFVRNTSEIDLRSYNRLL